MSPTHPDDIRLPDGAEELLARLSAPDRPDAQWEEQVEAILARTLSQDEAAPRSAIRFTAIPLADDELFAPPCPCLDDEPANAAHAGGAVRPPEHTGGAIPGLAAIARSVAARPAAEDGEDLIAESLRLATRRRHVEPPEPPPAWPAEREARAPAADTARERAAAALQSPVAPPSRRPAAVQLPDATPADATPADATPADATPADSGAAPSPEPAQAAPPPSSRLGLGMLLGAGLATAAAAVLFITTQRGPERPASIAAPQEVAATTDPQARAAAQPGASADPDPIITLDDLPSESEIRAPETPAGRDTVPQRLSSPSAPAKETAGTAAQTAAAAPPAEPAPAAQAAAEPPPEPAQAAAQAPEAARPEPEMRPAMLTDLPDKPSVGAVQAAIGTVMGSARACIAGHDQGSKATVVFGSDGRVQRVDVGSPAAGTPAESCIRAALERARTAPFAQPRFSAAFTVRPR